MLHNPTDKPWLVLKFGGTSIGKFLNAMTDIIQTSIEHHRVVLVCSARSNDTKSQGTTSLLLQAAHHLFPTNDAIKQHLLLIDQIMDDHCRAAWRSIKDYSRRSQLEGDITDTCRKLHAFMQAAEIIDELTPKSLDYIISMGERLSCMLVAAALQDKGLDATVVGMEDVVERAWIQTYSKSTALDQGFYDLVSGAMALRVQDCKDRIPVVTGFFGPVPHGILTTVGRGYTDLTAALLSAGLHAEECQIWKEVDGVFTADPNKVKEARLLSHITPEEAAELTFFGSQVIHPFTMEQAIHKRVPIRIKNVMKPLDKGTVIYPTTTEVRAKPTAVTIKEPVWIINVHSNKLHVSHGFLAGVFSCMDKHGLVVDLISTSEVHVSMAIGLHNQSNPYTCHAHDMSDTIEELKRLGDVDVHKDMAILSLVGREMRSMVGVAAKMFTTLAQSNVNIEMISQGASEINISCVINKDKSSQALNAVHDALLCTS
jgi:aspartate kinase